MRLVVKLKKEISNLVRVRLLAKIFILWDLLLSLVKGEGERTARGNKKQFLKLMKRMFFYLQMGSFKVNVALIGHCFVSLSNVD